MPRSKTKTAAPAPKTHRRAEKPAVLPVAPGPATKLQTLTSLLQRDGGATLDELVAATGWQAHSVRGALAGVVKRSLGAKVLSEKVDGVRVYRAPTG